MLEALFPRINIELAWQRTKNNIAQQMDLNQDNLAIIREAKQGETQPPFLAKIMSEGICI